MTAPLLRSVLYVPAATARALEKSASLRPDAIVYDLEDSAAPREKAAARERLREHLAGSPFGGERIVRITGLDTQWGAQDLVMARGAVAGAALLPKVESADALLQAADALAEIDAPETMALWAMIETPKGILDAGAIARGGKGRLAALVVGPHDITLTTGVRPSEGRPEFIPWLMGIVLAAMASGLAVLDGPHGAFREEAGFARECAQAARLGFTGKTLIHPSQIARANAAFSPSREALARARPIVAAFVRPENEASGAIALDGAMVERLHLRQAEALLALQETIVTRNEAHPA